MENIITRPNCFLCGKPIMVVSVATQPPTCAGCLASCNMEMKKRLDPAAFIPFEPKK